MSSPVISFDNVSKRFSRGYYADSLRDAVAQRVRSIFPGRGHEKKEDVNAFWALRGVSFQVEPGEVLGIIGSNGSGKSTTLKLLSRILRPDEGQIRVAGRLGALIELGAGFSPDLTGRENVYLNGSILGMSRDEIQAKYNSIVDFAELHDFMDTPVKWYSSGMYARLGFSVAVHTDPEILLVDEVLSVGDVGFQKKCFDKMMEFKNKSSVTTVFVSHNMNAVSTLCSRVILLEKGKVKSVGKPNEIIGKYMDIVRSFSTDKEDSVIEILESRIIDNNGNDCYAFFAKSRARIIVKIRARQSINRATLAILVDTRDDVFVFGTNTSRLSAAPFAINKDEEVHLELDLTMNLAPNSYNVSLSLIEGYSSDNIYNNKIGSFIINDDPKLIGLADLDPNLVSLTVSSSSSMSRSVNVAG